MSEQSEGIKDTGGDENKRHYKSISRIDQPSKHTHGWYVRVVFKGQMHAKFFSDSAYGNKRAALSQAVTFRNQKEKELGKPRTNRTVVGKNARTQTGVSGVHRVVKTSRAKDGEVRSSTVYEVTWSPEPNVLRRTSVSIDKYGEDEAFRRAVKLRQAREREVYGAPLNPKRPNSPTAASGEESEPAADVTPTA